jgi:hypothetical protein
MVGGETRGGFSSLSIGLPCPTIDYVDGTRTFDSQRAISEAEAVCSTSAQQNVQTRGTWRKPAVGRLQAIGQLCDMAALQNRLSPEHRILVRTCLIADVPKRHNRRAIRMLFEKTRLTPGA